MTTFRYWLFALFVAATGASASEEDDPAPRSVDFVVAVEESKGSYGDRAPTRILSTNFIVRYQAEHWSGAIEIPWLDVRSSGGDAGLPSSSGKGGSRERGLGDTWIRFTYELREFTYDTSGFDLTLKVKTKTGDVDRGLGSGGTDYAAQIKWMRALGPLRAFGHVGYRQTGDVKGFRPYRNPCFNELGAVVPLTAATEVGTYYSGRVALGRLGPLKELTIYSAWRGESQRVQRHLTRGFAKASPDWALGVTVRHRF
jgi:hypothetical protein